MEAHKLSVKLSKVVVLDFTCLVKNGDTVAECGWFIHFSFSQKVHQNVWPKFYIIIIREKIKESWLSFLGIQTET